MADALITVGDYIYDPYAKVFGRVRAMEEVVDRIGRVVGVKVAYQPVFRLNGKPFKNGAKGHVTSLRCTSNAAKKVKDLKKAKEQELALLEDMERVFEK